MLQTVFVCDSIHKFGICVCDATESTCEARNLFSFLNRLAVFFGDSYKRVFGMEELHDQTLVTKSYRCCGS